jgi:hypothetical protein
MGIFGKLAVAMSKGAETTAGIGTFYQWSKERLTTTLAKRFGLENPEDIAQLINFARSGVDGARGIQDDLTGIDQWLDAIPTNPYLFGDEPEGQRGLYIGEFQVIPGGKWHRTHIGFEDIPDLADWQSDIMAEAIRRIGRSPHAFGLPGGPETASLDIRLIFVERRF